VIFAQRFGSALNLNLHFHALLLDGAFVSSRSRCAPRFRPAAPLTDRDVADLVHALHRRITRYLQRKGHLPREHDAADDSAQTEPDEPLFAAIEAASIQGRSALAPDSQPPIARLGRSTHQRRPALPGSLCCDHEGFSLHAKVLIPAGEPERLEHLCRYIARPPIATGRLSISKSGRVVYGLRRHWRDGTSAVSFDPLTFIERLAALVPRPRAHQLTYHGVLAPAAAWRDLVVPAQPKRRGAPSPDSASPSERQGQHRLTWAELLKRVFAIDVLVCPHCGAKRKPIALITQPEVIRKILSHLGLPTEPPRLTPARSTPELEFA
jgi:hypothetical protein